MAGRKRHSAEDIVRKFRRADELAAEGNAGEEVAAELGSLRPRCTTGATPTAGSIPTRLSARAECPVKSGCWQKPSWRRTRCARWRRENSESGRQAPRPRTLTYVKGLSERLSRKAIGLARSTYRRLQLAQTTADPDAEMRVWLRTYAATKHPCQNSQGAGRAALRPAP